LSRLPPNRHSFSLGEWQVDSARGTILGADGKETRLEPQLMDLLLLFAGAPGEVLSKDRIIASVWSGRAIGDDTLAAAISRLRAALGSSKHIETIPKRGYRLVIAPDRAAVGHVRRAGSGTDQAVTQGFAILKSPTPLTLGQAKLYFESAIKADAARADAHAGLAQTLLLQHLTGNEPSAVLVQAAQAVARAALVLDDGHAFAWAVLGCATLFADREFAVADDAFQKSLACNPDLSLAHRYRGLALAAAGRFVEAEREARAAIKGDPVSLSTRTELLQYLLLARRYVPALAEAKRMLALAPLARDAWSAKGWAHFMLGEEQEARDAFLESLRTWGMDAATLAKLTKTHYRGGMPAFCAAVADVFEGQQVGFIPRLTDIAILRACAGDADACFAALNKAAASNDPYLLWVLRMPQLDRLRNDPRFPALLERARPVR
jgi:DNA-binding winged helix-turn-helix (wHTH) protein/Flp pilus assembly protein TadD